MRLANPPPLSQDSWHSALLPKERLPKNQGQEPVCHPRGMGLQGTGFPERWHCPIYLGILREHGTSSTCGERWGSREGGGMGQGMIHLFLASLGP